ncbi:hypothetical protein F2Q70_00016013 [Brassica cretica]|uniref:Uncharacterized protein n=1 Tax=Brassica cretica TaxID=69181 RepID=A0A8S9I2C6_BRACR|nr:hypothetical protein F2Q70_00016013 [Brassica cretica]KAF2596477.1 hypothetical protein F2Q68_00008938 [Brassica cretica]
MECFHGISWRDRGLYTHDRESNDLVNHIRGVFRYFIVDIVDLGSTPDLACYGRKLEHMLIDLWSPCLEEERHMKKLPSETEETRKVKEIFGLQEKKENGWTFFAAAAQIYGGMIHKFGEGFHGVLGLKLHGISVADGVLIYVGISARVKDVAEGLKGINSCGFLFGVTHSFLLEWICENEELLVQGRVRLNREYKGEKNESTGYHSCRGDDLFEQSSGVETHKKKERMVEYLCGGRVAGDKDRSEISNNEVVEELIVSEL